MPSEIAELDALCVNTIRGLAIDAVQKANSGHPGLPLGAAAFAYSLWTRHLHHSPANPKWFNRDRFVLSAGHGSMLLYALLHLTGYDVSMDDLKSFRQLHSKTPGHPEYGHTAGVEATTGPLGQGFANGVGFAIAEAWLAATYNRPGHDVVDHKTYVICSDGDLMEGIATEAASLAGHLELGKLIVLYDDNDISLDGPTALSFNEDIPSKFAAMGWHVQSIDGLNVDATDRAIREAISHNGKPSLIACKTIIGFGSPNKAGSSKSHGSALGPDEVKLTKSALGLPPDQDFYTPEDALSHFRQAVATGQEREGKWAKVLEAYAIAHPDEHAKFTAAMAGDFGSEWVGALPSFSAEVSAATRESGRAVLKAIGALHTGLLGGNADLSESTYALQHDSGDFSRTNNAGRNIFFGVREHAMAAALNGMTLHGGVHSYGGTFFNFSDYCKPSIRLAALMGCPVTFIFTHDSIGLGEDGPTHQPIEQLTGLRAMPNLNVIRPADGNETSAAWKIALESKSTPTLLVLSRQNLPTLTTQDVRTHPAHMGGYVLHEAEGGPAHVTLIGTGSELQHCVAARSALQSEGIGARVVSMPSTYLFDKQASEYRESVLGVVPRVAIEAGATLGWYKYAQTVVGIDQFGLSAPADQIMKELGMNADHLVAVVKATLGK